MEKELTKELTFEEAIRYLNKNNCYEDEWKGAGMWEAVNDVCSYKGKLTVKYLEELLKNAEER